VVGLCVVEVASYWSSMLMCWVVDIVPKLVVIVGGVGRVVIFICILIITCFYR
jgi:hypothetical protein